MASVLANVELLLLASSALDFYWGAAALSSLALLLRIPLPRATLEMLKTAASRGKTWRGSQNARSVPQSWFSHFYFVAVTTTMATLAAIHYATHTLRLWEFGHVRAHLALFLFQGHVVRRLAECLQVHRFSPGSRMHVLGYLVGIR